MKGLKAKSKEHGLPLNTMVQFAWHKLLQVYTRDEQTMLERRYQEGVYR